MKKGQIRLLNEQEVQQSITAPQTLELVEKVFRYAEQHNLGSCWISRTPCKFAA